MFRGIKGDPLELIRYAQRKCYAWFDGNSGASENAQQLHQIHNAQVYMLAEYLFSRWIMEFRIKI